MLTEKVDVPEYFKKVNRNCEWIGYLPLIDDRWNYFTVENIHPHKEFDRVSVIWGFIRDSAYANEEFAPCTEIHYRRYYKNNGISYSQYMKKVEVSEKFIQENPYVLLFQGCDDSDVMLRFPDKIKAIEFLENIEFFDEIMALEQLLRIN